jgi:hypothetical protein
MALRVYAEHKLGLMLKENPPPDGRPIKNGLEAKPFSPLRKLGIDKKLSFRSQAIAELPFKRGQSMRHRSSRLVQNAFGLYDLSSVLACSPMAETIHFSSVLKVAQAIAGWLDLRNGPPPSDRERHFAASRPMPALTGVRVEMARRLLGIYSV